jgi:type I restriction enzyme S subunit
MQQLLTGKKRLPGFGSDERQKECHSERSAKREVKESSGYKMTELGLIPSDWEVKTVGKLLKIGHGRDYKNLKSGKVPVYGTGGYMTSVNDYLYEGETVCIGRKGTIDKPFYHTGKIWTVDTLFYTYGFNGCIPKFIYYEFCLVEWLAMNEASGVPSLTSKNIEDVLLRIPPSKAEQTAIANVLSDMDAEIATLETKLAKYRTLKTGMMQQLLTGKIRLV